MESSMLCDCLRNYLKIVTMMTPSSEPESFVPPEDFIVQGGYREEVIFYKRTTTSSSPVGIVVKHLGTRDRVFGGSFGKS